MRKKFRGELTVRQVQGSVLDRNRDVETEVTAADVSVN